MSTTTTQQCIQCSKTFKVTGEELAFGRRFGVENIALCFECDHKNRLCFRTEWHLYSRRCDFSGKDIVSTYAADAAFPVYDSAIWYSDQWDPLSYGRPIDFTRSFFEQYQALQCVVPRLALSNVNGENSEYCHSTIGNKNCYLIFGGDFNEDTMYGSLCMNNRSSLDIDYSNNCELCYMSIDCVRCYGCQFAFNSKHCTNCYFVSDCSGCTECLFSSHLVNKSYCINNIQYTKAEYVQKKAQLLTGSYRQQQTNLNTFMDARKKRIVKYVNAIAALDSTGDYLKNCQRCTHCFDVSDSEQLHSVIFAAKARDCMNSDMIGHNSELCYDIFSVVGSSNAQQSYFVIESSNVAYCEFVMNSQDLFGCIGLRQKRYCILNQSYTAGEYARLRERLVAYMKQTGEWGQFFPKQLSAFGYNETSAHVNYPLTKEQALQQGYRWRDEVAPSADVAVAVDQIPDDIAAVTPDIIDQALTCRTCHKLFKILPAELEFYQTQTLPLPRQCPTCRFSWRLSLRNPRQLWQRQCMCTQTDHQHAGRCRNEFATTYSPERLELVYCEDCYQKEVY